MRDLPKITFVAGEALEKNRLVKLDSTDNQVVYADDGDEPIGVTEHAAAASGEHVSVRTFAPTFEVEASAAISLGDRLHTEDDGKVRTALAGEESPLVALQAATASGDIIEAMFVPSEVAKPSVVKITDDTDDATITAGQMGDALTILDLGYAGASALAIPGAATVSGLFLLKKTGSAGAVTITPAAGTIAGGATHNSLDADNDWMLIAPVEADWVIVASAIA